MTDTKAWCLFFGATWATIFAAGVLFPWWVMTAMLGMLAVIFLLGVLR